MGYCMTSVLDFCDSRLLASRTRSNCWIDGEMAVRVMNSGIWVSYLPVFCYALEPRLFGYTIPNVYRATDCVDGEQCTVIQKAIQCRLNEAHISPVSSIAD